TNRRGNLEVESHAESLNFKRNALSEVAQTDQTEPLDLSILKRKEKRNGLQDLSMERENEEEIGLQVFQTKPLDLSASKVKEEGNKLEGLSVEGMGDERIKPRRQLVPIETVVETKRGLKFHMQNH
ncbi:unnamed protein product, partial [Brugia pahangi]|uniref:Centromere protein J n=1 Tax=Brugia pahangi TaxID=6280 RepID=A0A0N4TVW4_BRUPA